MNDIKVTVKYFHRIDILRFLAAMMVVVFHAYKRYETTHAGLPSFLFNGSGFSIGNLLQQALKNGDFGVDIFFLLSGFLITFLLITEKEKTGKINLKNFFLRRSLRIWPLFYLVVFTAPLISHLFSTNYAPVYTNALFINNFWVIQTGWWMFPTAQLWSLCIEEHFYLVWPVLLACIPTKRMPIVFSLVILVSFFYRFYVGYFDNCNWFKLYLHTFSRMDALAIGAYTAWYYVKRPFQFTAHWSLRLTIVLIFLVLFTTSNISSWETPFFACFKNLICLLLTWFIILNFLFHEKPFFRLPFDKLFNYLGRISYGIYIYGLIILTFVQEKVLPYFHQESNMFLYWFLVITLSIIIPCISFELYEKHFLKLKNKFQIVKQI